MSETKGLPPEIDAYLAAFAAANPGVGLPTIKKRPGGWYGYRSAGSAYISPKRMRDIVVMTERLLSRATSGE